MSVRGTGHFNFLIMQTKRTIGEELSGLTGQYAWACQSGIICMKGLVFFYNQLLPVGVNCPGRQTLSGSFSRFSTYLQTANNPEQRLWFTISRWRICCTV